VGLAAIKSFFNFSNWSVYLIIGAVLVYGYFRIDALKSENDLLENQVEQVVTANQNLERDMNEFRSQVVRDLGKQQQYADEIRESNERNNQIISELYETFNTSADGTERDLEALSEAKPGLIERRINDATKKVFDDVEKNSNFNSDQ
jgi:L-rhamnose mutarotase